jgi:hypothetical protein
MMQETEKSSSTGSPPEGQKGLLPPCRLSRRVAVVPVPVPVRMVVPVWTKQTTPQEHSINALNEGAAGVGTKQTTPPVSAGVVGFLLALAGLGQA